jgi:soluble lytic murein transglycosylase-like protein
MEAPKVMISAAWDPVIERYAGQVPVAFIRALVHGESGGDSQKENPTSHAAGLLQITDIVRKDWNTAHPDAPVGRSDLFDPEINVRIGAALLNRIVLVYRHHPTLRPDWGSRRYAELVGLGWNAGYSDRGGVGLAVAALEAAGAQPADVTVDSVARVAVGLPNASRFVARADRVAYAKAVADLYLGSRGGRVVAGHGGGVTGPVVIAALGALGLAHFGRRGGSA